MSTTVTYKGSTLTTVNNQTRVLNTAGKWLEGDITLVDVTSGGITPTGTLNISANGTYDVTNYASAVVSVSGGGTPSATAHTIHFEFDGNYSPVNITFYADSTFILDAIRATTPSTYDSKTVTLAQLDNVTWYSYDPTSSIPLNTQLIDFNSITNGYTVAGDGSLAETEWFAVTDYTEIDPSMTFSYRGAIWFNLGFYDSSKAAISTIYIYSDATADPDNDQVGVGTLTPAKIPANAKYVRISCAQGANADYVSLIRTA